MKLLLGLAALVPAAVHSTNTAVTPVQKVVQLLTGMLEKGKAEKHDEQVQYAAYKQFCDDTAVDKTRAIKEADEKIGLLQADIEKYVAEADRLTREIAVHDDDIAAWTGDKKAATHVRGVEKEDYDTTHKDYTESIDALQRAIEVLKKPAHDRNQASFSQISALKVLDLIPAEAKQAIDTFLLQDPLSVSAPDAKGYEFKSHGIIEMLNELLDKFTAEQTSLEKAEMNSKHTYELLIQDMTAQIDEASRDRSDKTQTKASKLQAKADAEGDLEDTTATRDSDKAYLSNLQTTCTQKASEFEGRQHLRSEEIAAIQKAIEIISSGAVAGAAEKHLPALAQKKGSALAHLRADTQGQVQVRASQYLRDRAAKLNSRVLSDLVSRVAEDPFQKVRKMIQDLVQRLIEEAGEEADHKGWCDTELAANEQTRKEKTAAVENLHAEIDELDASIAKLTEDLASLAAAVSELDANVAKATELRQQEKAKNIETIKDAAAAQAAVAQALTVLKEFYAKAAGATVLAQQEPEVFSAPYKGMQSENGGVLGMLEVIESDFARLEAETSSSEATAQKEYDNFMKASEEDKAQKTVDIEHKTAKKQDENQMLTIKRADLEGNQKELDASLAYFDKLKPSCIDSGVSYEDRVARRNEEIASLQEALKILNGESV